jgi:hypothetical protein
MSSSGASSGDKKLVDLTAPYANDGKGNAKNVSDKVSAGVGVGGTSTAPVLVGSTIKVLDKGEVADHRKFGNGKDVSDELAHAAPKREKDLHPSKTYQGAGDEVDEAEWN